MAWPFLGTVIFMILFCGACAAPPPPSTTAASPRPTVTAVRSGAPFPAAAIVSVLPFDEHTRLSEIAWVRKGLPDMLIAQLVRLPSVIVVQRERLEEVLREQSFQLSGRVADETAVRIGRLAGATVLVTGSVAVISGVVHIECQLLSVEQGAVLGIVTAEGLPAEIMPMARLVAARAAELVPHGSEARMVISEPSDDLSAAARSAQLGEQLWQQGSTQEALAALERAMAADPAYAPAKWTYGRLVREVKGRDLLSAASVSPREAAGRIVEQFLEGAFGFETGQPRTDRQADGTTRLRIPVRVALFRPAVDALVEAAIAVGGGSRPADVEAGPPQLDVEFGPDPELGRQVVSRMLTPRRLYLKLLSHDQRVMAVYSSLKDWVPATWLSTQDGQRVRVAQERSVDGDAIFAGLTEQHLAAMYGFRLSVEPVTREQATVRVDAVEWEPPGRDGRSRSRDETVRPPMSSTEMAHADAAAQAWQMLLERMWRPPVSERPWGPGYRPGNERSAIVTFDPDPSATPAIRLNRSSGDSAFDDAAVGAAQQAAARWQLDPKPSLPKGRLRAQFRLVKDLPLLNVVEPAAKAAPFAGVALPSR